MKNRNIKGRLSFVCSVLILKLCSMKTSDMFVLFWMTFEELCSYGLVTIEENQKSRLQKHQTETCSEGTMYLKKRGNKLEV